MFIIPNGVRAISFDIWKTLLNGNSNYTWPRLELVFGYVGILGYGQEAITAAYRRAEKHLNAEAERTGYDTGMAERIEFILNDLGVTGLQVPDEATIIELQKQSGVLRVLPEYLPSLTEPDLVDTLRKLRDAGYVIGTLSNTGMGDCNMIRPVLEHYGLDQLLEVTLFSCEDGRAKPNPGIFHRMAKELDCEPHEVLHVGDNANADCRATEVGLHVALYAPAGKPEGNLYPYITSIRELLG